MNVKQNKKKIKRSLNKMCLIESKRGVKSKTKSSLCSKRDFKKLLGKANQNIRLKMKNSMRFTNTKVLKSGRES